MNGFDVVPSVLDRAGTRFLATSTAFGVTLDPFAATAQVPSSAAGPLGSAEDALTAYEGLLAHVVKHLHSLHDAVEETGTRLRTSAAKYEEMERVNTLPGD